MEINGRYVNFMEQLWTNQEIKIWTDQGILRPVFSVLYFPKSIDLLGYNFPNGYEVQYYGISNCAAAPTDEVGASRAQRKFVLKHCTIIGDTIDNNGGEMPREEITIGQDLVELGNDETKKLMTAIHHRQLIR